MSLVYSLALRNSCSITSILLTFPLLVTSGCLSLEGLQAEVCDTNITYFNAATKTCTPYKKKGGLCGDGSKIPNKDLACPPDTTCANDLQDPAVQLAISEPVCVDSSLQVTQFLARTGADSCVLIPLEHQGGDAYATTFPEVPLTLNKPALVPQGEELIKVHRDASGYVVGKEYRVATTHVLITCTAYFEDPKDPDPGKKIVFVGDSYVLGYPLYVRTAASIPNPPGPNKQLLSDLRAGANTITIDGKPGQRGVLISLDQITKAIQGNV